MVYTYSAIVHSIVKHSIIDVFLQLIKRLVSHNHEGSMKENIQALIDHSKEVDLEVNPE
jgi:hypothetical protein